MSWWRLWGGVVRASALDDDGFVAGFLFLLDLALSSGGRGAYLYSRLQFSMFEEASLGLFRDEGPLYPKYLVFELYSIILTCSLLACSRWCRHKAIEVLKNLLGFHFYHAIFKFCCSVRRYLASIIEECWISFPLLPSRDAAFSHQPTRVTTFTKMALLRMYQYLIERNFPRNSSSKCTSKSEELHVQSQAANLALRAECPCWANYRSSLSSSLAWTPCCTIFLLEPNQNTIAAARVSIYCNLLWGDCHISILTCMQGRICSNLKGACRHSILFHSSAKVAIPVFESQENTSTQQIQHPPHHIHNLLPCFYAIASRKFQYLNRNPRCS